LCYPSCRAAEAVPPGATYALNFSCFKYRLRYSSKPTLSAFALSVSLTAPASGAVFQAGASIALSASATPTNSSRPIVKVEFFRGGTTLIGSDTTSPYSFTWTNVPAGSYTITAKATDSSGATATSASRTIKVNAPPTVSLTGPANGALFSPGSTIALTATAADSDGTISKVEFLRGGSTLIGQDTSSPYSFSWTNVASGAYTLTARATDSNGAVTTSAAVSIVVDTPPTVSIASPANGAVVLPGAAVTVTANAADPDGTVSKVDFFDGATVIGTATAAPFSATFTPAAGSHSLTAVATDNLGRSTTSAAVSIRSDAAPTVSITSPASGTVFASPASFTIAATAADSDGTISKVEFFDGATLVATATAAPYSVSLANVAPGTHGYTARATDNNGAVTASAAVSVIVNTLPTVSLTSPAAGASFNAPASIALAADAADADGTVAKVDFYQGTTLLGTATAAPYGFAWTNVGSGSYSLTAVATDNRGGTASSAAVAITVNAAPSVSITAPASNALFPAPATITVTADATDPDGTIAKVDFFQGATLIGTATAAPYSVTASDLASGSYSFTAVATDNSGATTSSAPVSVRVNAAPTVSLTNPSGGATFNAPASINIAATALDADGTIAKVEFYRNGTLITTLTAAPYSFTWSGVPQGSYTLTAVVTDDAGATATSAPVAVTVGAHVAQMYFVHPDHLNTPRSITNQSGNEVWRWDNTEPFGDSVPNDNPLGFGAFEFNSRGAGQYSDQETGIIYNYFRYLDPARGQYGQSDPIGLRGGINGYAYVKGEPLRYIDPFGLSWVGAWQSMKDLWAWSQGTLGNPNYGPNDPITQDLKGTPMMDDIRSQFKANGCKDGVYCGNFQYSQFLSTGTIVGQTVGSFCARLNSNGGMISVDAWNTWGLESGTRFPELPGQGSNRGNASVQQIITGGGSISQWPKSLLENTTSGAFANSTTRYQWTEPSPCCK
jgi:RHS repeat-associated protein